MSRIKIMLVGLLAVLAMDSVASATASAAVQGPWFRHLNANGEQVKYPMNEEQTITSSNQSPFILKGEVAGLKAIIECATVTNKGFLWNGAHQGEDEAVVLFTNCAVTSPVKCPATVSEVKVYTELMWKYKGVSSELTESPSTTQQKIYDAFAPTEAAREVEPGVFRSTFATLTLPKECNLLAGTFNVEAVGTKTIFTDQHQVEHKIVWGTAAFVAPQNYDLKTAELVWNDPNVTWLHHQETPITAKLFFGNKPAELQGQIAVERGGEKFGAFNE